MQDHRDIKVEVRQQGMKIGHLAILNAIQDIEDIQGHNKLSLLFSYIVGSLYFWRIRFFQFTSTESGTKVC